MVLRILPVAAILLLLVFPSTLNRMGMERSPLYTPENAGVIPSAAAFNDQGVELYFDGKLEEALANFVLASEADPGFAIAHYNCAVVLTTRGYGGDLAEAMRHLEWSYQLDPGNALIQEFLLELVQQAPLTA